MQIIEKHNFEFTSQFDDTQRLHSLKCELLEKNTDPFEPVLRINREHLKPLYDVPDNELMTAEHDDIDDSLYIQMALKKEGVFFEAAYLIDMNSGKVRFAMDKPLISLKDFVIPKEFEEDLKERINELKSQDKLLESFNDERLDRYFSDKYLQMFIDYAEYMEQLIEANKCNECIQRFKYRLSKFCNEFYSKDKCKPED